MNEALWQQAEELARQIYDVVVERDVLTTGQEVFLATHPELPGCKAQGRTLEEAMAKLVEARVDYIYTLLEVGLAIPVPSESKAT